MPLQDKCKLLYHELQTERKPLEQKRELSRPAPGCSRPATDPLLQFRAQRRQSGSGLGVRSGAGPTEQESRVTSKFARSRSRRSKAARATVK